MQNSGGAETIVLRTPTFVELNGVKTTRPSGTSVAPKNLVVVAEVVVEFENDNAIGSNIPTLDVLEGANTMLPAGVKAPPENPDAPVILENAKFEGLKTPTLALPVKGTNTTFPLGARTPPENLPRAVPEKGPIFEKV